jgi:hypothetical protein
MTRVSTGHMTLKTAKIPEILHELFHELGMCVDSTRHVEENSLKTAISDNIETKNGEFQSNRHAKSTERSSPAADTCLFEPYEPPDNTNICNGALPCRVIDDRLGR